MAERESSRKLSQTHAVHPVLAVAVHLAVWGE